jgi:geranylgeranyl diphosphate synthase, type II
VSFDLSTYLESRRALVDAALDRVLPPEQTPPVTVHRAMRYSVLAPGKRLRPILVIAGAEAVGGEAAAVMDTACALELIHAYSLIHDDLPAMDDDELRRGQPTCHVAYGEDVAILAGDGLFAEALRLALSEQGGEPENVLAAVTELVAAAGVHGMVGGQYLDVTARGVPEAAELRRLHELKTGALIAASVGTVLAWAGPNGPATIPLRRFAAELGVVFQIVDDILDVTGDEAELGKSRGSDARLGKPTYVSVFGLERARELAQESHTKARAALAEADGDTTTLGRISDYILTRQA